MCVPGVFSDLSLPFGYHREREREQGQRATKEKEMKRENYDRCAGDNFQCDIPKTHAKGFAKTYSSTALY